MARKQKTTNPVNGGVRRRRTTAPRMSPNGSVIEYSVLGATVTSDAASLGRSSRVYCPGTPDFLANATGPNVCSFYSTGKFLPGSKIRWEPSVSFTTSGRIYVGFTDNPEVAKTIFPLAGTTYVNAIKGLGDVISFPVWQETDVNFPSRLRRKMFDTNISIDYTNVDVLDRSVQTFMFVAVDGVPASTALGSFWYHDKVMVEGLQAVAT